MPYGVGSNKSKQGLELSQKSVAAEVPLSLNEDDELLGDPVLPSIKKSSPKEKEEKKALAPVAIPNELLKIGKKPNDAAAKSKQDSKMSAFQKRLLTAQPSSNLSSEITILLGSSLMVGRGASIKQNA